MNSLAGLPFVNQSFLTNNNLISLYSKPVNIEFDGQNYTLRLTLEADQKFTQPSCVSLLKVAESTFSITVSQWPEFVLKNHTDIVPLLRSHSPIIRKMANEVLLCPIVTWIENIVGEKPVILDSVKKEAQLINPYIFYYCLTHQSGSSTSGLIKINNGSSAELEKLLRHCAPTSINDLNDFKLKTRLNIGSSMLSTSELYNLEMGDVILFDHDIYGKEKNVLATISDRIQLLLSNNEEGVLIVNKISSQLSRDSKMTEEQPENIQEPSPDNPSKQSDPELSFIDELNVKLDFDLGSISLPISDIKNLSPGYILSLDKPIDRSVQIYSNGQLLGLGEIVNIDGTTGVRLKSFLGK